jgi:hypothetical protein
MFAALGLAALMVSYSPYGLANTFRLQDAQVLLGLANRLIAIEHSVRSPPRSDPYATLCYTQIMTALQWTIATVQELHVLVFISQAMINPLDERQVNEYISTNVNIDLKALASRQQQLIGLEQSCSRLGLVNLQSLSELFMEIDTEMRALARRV